MRNYRTWLIVVVTLIGVLLAPTTGNAVRKPLVVGYDLWIGYAPVFIAQDKGFFQEHGLTIKLVSFPGPGDTLAALIAGHLDVGLTTVNNAIFLHDKGASIVNVFFTDSSHGADTIVARTEIASLRDLKGRRIAATLGEVNHFLLLQALERAGLREEDCCASYDLELHRSAVRMVESEGGIFGWVSTAREFLKAITPQ